MHHKLSTLPNNTIFQEAGCIYLGISYDPALSDKWSALSSVKLKDYELGLTIKGFIDTFNITTKDWFIR